MWYNNFRIGNCLWKVIVQMKIIQSKLILQRNPKIKIIEKIKELKNGKITKLKKIFRPVK